MRTPVGIIGLGIMGSAMAASLLRAGHAVVGYDVVARRRRDHRRVGGMIAKNAAGVGSTADIVISSLPSAEALLQTALDLSHAPRRRQIVIETSTLPIAVKDEARQRLAAGGITLLDCPLSGTGVQARTKDLVVYGSGDRPAYRRVIPVLQAFARAQYYVGGFGAGSKVKFIANLLVAVHNVAAAEALVLGMKAGLDLDLLVKVIGDGAGTSRMFQVRAPVMAKGDYSNAMMKLEVWQKDMRIIADFAREVDCPTPLFAASAPIYTAATASGRRGEDTAAVCAVLEKLAGIGRKLKVKS
ncbi:MAG: NAD(P)-dependent oxidoreductase [Blastocatellia bacterium]|nr:MAG: NAD(P)-dependent oxidoreductase [Blastocatellia bacterium]